MSLETIFLALGTSGVWSAFPQWHLTDHLYPNPFHSHIPWSYRHTTIISTQPRLSQCWIKLKLCDNMTIFYCYLNGNSNDITFSDSPSNHSWRYGDCFPACVPLPYLLWPCRSPCMPCWMPCSSSSWTLVSQIQIYLISLNIMANEVLASPLWLWVVVGHHPLSTNHQLGLTQHA